MDRRTFIKSSAALLASPTWTKNIIVGKTHIISLSFDDGFKKSFHRIVQIHEAYGLKACLNVIAQGHVPGAVKVPSIAAFELGDFDDWNRFKEKGHEVMPHSWNHRNLTEMPLEEAKDDIDRCLDYFRKNLKGYDDTKAVYNFPFNASTSEVEDFTLGRVRAVRTGGWLVLNGTRENKMPSREGPLRLGCWSHGPERSDEMFEGYIQAFLASEGGWHILNMHGLDGEGWGPVSAGYLDGLFKRLIRIPHLEVLPVGAVLERAH